MKIVYDKNVDAIYINVTGQSDEVITTDSFSIENLIPFGDINIDFNENNHIVGFEILNATSYFPKGFLDTLH